VRRLKEASANGSAHGSSGSGPAGARPAAAPAMLAYFAPVLLDHVPQALAMFDTRMRYLAANRRFTTAFGLDQREILGRSHYELFPDLHANWRHLFERALAGEAGRIDEDFFQRGDGTSDWVRWDVRPWREPDGEIGGLVLSQEIITPRKREERRRVFDRNLAVSLFESQSLPMLLVGLDGRILRSSPAARAALGMQPTADGRMPFWEVYPDREQEEAEKERFAALATPPDDGTLGGYAPADIIVPGTPVQRLHWSASPHRNAAGVTQAVLLTASLVDVARPVSPPPVPTGKSETPAPSEEPAAQVAPPIAPRLADNLSRHLPFGLVLLDREGIVTAANEAVIALLGRPLAVGNPFEPWLADSAPEEVLREPVLREWRDNVWRRHMARTFSLTSTDGLLKEIELRPRLLPDGHLLLMLSDVTESRRAEDALRTSEAKYRGLFRELPTGIALADRTGALVEGNPALEKLTGYSRVDLRRLRLSDLVEMQPTNGETPPEARPALVVARDGSRHPVTVSQGPIRNPAGDAVLQACFFLPRATPAPPEPADEPAPEAALPALPTPTEAESAWRDLAFASLRTAMLVTDLRGRIRAANPAAARFFGADEDSLIGTALYRLFRPQDPAAFSRDVSESLNATKRWERETMFHDPEGTPVGNCRAEITPAAGDISPGLLCVVQPVFAPVVAAG
jgi:PAS domain S-box-containing protein